MSHEDLKRGLMDFVAEQGYRPEIDKDGDIHFKYEGGDYFLCLDEKDTTYYRLLFPGFWPIESENERQKAVLACVHATAQTKVAKVYIVNSNVSASVEMFYDPMSDVKRVFPRTLSALKHSVATFAEEMRK